MSDILAPQPSLTAPRAAKPEASPVVSKDIVDAVKTPGAMAANPSRRSWYVRWRRFLPDRMATRIAVTVVTAILLTQVISFLLIIGSRVNFLLPLRNLDAVTARIAVPVRALSAIPAADRPALAAQLSTNGVTVTWQPIYQPKGPEDDRFPTNMLRGHVHHSLTDIVDVVLVEAVDGTQHFDMPPPLPIPPIFHLHGPPNLHSRLWLRLADQSWVTVEMDDADLIQFNPLHLIIGWTLSLIAILWLSVMVARRMTRPLRNFAEAAEKLGTGQDQALLAETGPEELRDATRAFNIMQLRLKRFIDDRTQMLAAISHDLRTPISRLLLRISNLEDGEERRKMVSDLQLMDHMIGATLDFVRDDTLSEPQQRVDLGSLIESLIDDATTLGGNVQYQGPAFVTCACRPLAISRAIGNVIDNAIKYGGNTLVELTQADGIIITVSDDGPGIPAAAFDKVFDPFFRLDPARGSTPRSANADDDQDIALETAERPGASGGSGLGLSIARNIILAHGGEIALANRAEGGLQVRIRLPL